MSRSAMQFIFQEKCSKGLGRSYVILSSMHEMDENNDYCSKGQPYPF